MCSVNSCVLLICQCYACLIFPTFWGFFSGKLLASIYQWSESLAFVTFSLFRRVRRCMWPLTAVRLHLFLLHLWSLKPHPTLDVRTLSLLRRIQGAPMKKSPLEKPMYVTIGPNSNVID